MNSGDQTNKSLSAAQISKSELKCPLCQYVWKTGIKERTINCPNCKKRIPNPFSTNPGNFVTCKKCNHFWCTTVTDKVIICPKCLNQNINPVFSPKKEGKPKESLYVKCSKCDYQWYYKGDKKVGDLVLCPNCSRLIGLYPALNEVIDTSKPLSKFQTTIKTEPPKTWKITGNQTKSKEKPLIFHSPQIPKVSPVPQNSQNNFVNVDNAPSDTQDLSKSMKPEERLTLHIELLRARIDVLEMSLHLDKPSWQISAKRVNDTANEVMRIIEESTLQESAINQTEKEFPVEDKSPDQIPKTKESAPWVLPQQLRGVKGKWGVYEVNHVGKSRAIGAYARNLAWKEAYNICDKGKIGTRSEVRSITEQAIDVRYVKTSDGVRKEWVIPF